MQAVLAQAFTRRGDRERALRDRLCPRGVRPPLRQTAEAEGKLSSG